MTSRCTVCRHGEVVAINTALASGASNRAVAGQFGLSRSAVGNHASAHLRAALATASPDAATTALQTMVETRRRTDLAASASVRDHVIRDLAMLESLLAVAGAAGDAGKVSALLRTKYLIVSRTGLTDDADRALSTAPMDDDDPWRQHMAKMDRVADAIMGVVESARPRHLRLAFDTQNEGEEATP